MARTIVYARFSAHISPTIMLNEGEPWDAADPVVAEHPDFFTDAPAHVRTSRPAEPGSAEPWGPPADEPAGVEQATAAPGERRTLTPPASTRRSGGDKS